MADDKKSLKELWAKVRDADSCERISSSKPFRPCNLHVIVSILAPHFYTKEELVQLKNFCNQETTKNDLIHKRSHQEDEEIADEEEIGKQMNKKSRKMIVSNNVAPRSLPPQFMNRISELNGSDIKFLMDKELYNSDICRNNNRLSMPKNKITCDFLTEDEMKILSKREGSNGHIHGMEVTLLDPSLREFALVLKKWEMRTIIYNLVTDWNRVVAENKFQKGYKLQIWSFRVDKMLYFLLNKV